MTFEDRIAASRRTIAQFSQAEYPGEICVVSSFGTESAALLHLVASVDHAIPVRFIDTGRHFPETLAYRDDLAARIGLTDLKSVRPDGRVIAARDPERALAQTDPDECCRIRKIAPFTAIAGRFRAVFTGRKRHHGADRTRLGTVEVVDGLVRIHPLADWTSDDLTRYMATHALPPHPLVAAGYRSIGCAPCTARSGDIGDFRAGRWQGTEKTECGIHLPATGTFGR
jgi:phosphoadenosine phosphosulfate reductase